MLTFINLYIELLPDSFDMISGPFSKKKYAPVSAATAFAIVVLPKPHLA